MRIAPQNYTFISYFNALECENHKKVKDYCCFIELDARIGLFFLSFLVPRHQELQLLLIKPYPFCPCAVATCDSATLPPLGQRVY